MPARNDVEWSQVSGLAGVAARGGLLTAAGTWGRFLLQFATVVVVARILGPAEYGFAAVVLVFSALSELIRYSGLASALLQRKDVTSPVASSLHYVSIGVGGVLGALVLTLAPVFGSALGDARFVVFAPMLGIILLAAGIATVPTALLTRNLSFGALVVAELTAVVVSCIAAVGLAAMGLGAAALVWQALIFACVVCVGALLACPWRPGRLAARAASAPFLKFGVNAAAVQVFRYVSQNTDRVALSAATGAVATGLYAQANQLIMLPVAQISGPLQRIVLPVLSRLVDDPARYRLYYRHIVALVAYTLWPVFVALFFLADSLIVTLFGAEWAGSVPIFQILAVAGIANTLIYVNSWVFVSTGNVRNQSRLMFVTAPLTVVGVFVGLAGGVEGVAAAITISAVVSVVPGFLVSKQGAPVTAGDLLRPLLWPTVVSVVVGMVTATAVALAPPTSLTGLLVGGASALLSYVTCLMVFPPARRSLSPVLGQLRRPADQPSRRDHVVASATT
jgi:O-antigen/teichoic acid export membrane protein